MRLNSEQNDDECLSSSLHPNESVTITIYDDGDDEQIDFEPKKHRALIHYLFGGLLLFAFIFGILSFWNAHSKSKLNDDVERNLLAEERRIDVAEAGRAEEQRKADINFAVGLAGMGIAGIGSCMQCVIVQVIGWLLILVASCVGAFQQLKDE